MPVIKLPTKIGRIIATFGESVTLVVSTVSAVIGSCGLNVLFISGAVIITRKSKNYRRKTTPYPEYYFVTALRRNARTKKSPVNRPRGD
jgi:Ca2+/Na+ antiporter